MANPFAKKNPFMSLWLSGANKAASAGRGLFMAEARRQQAAILREASKAVANSWSGALKPKPAPRGKKKSKG